MQGKTVLVVDDEPHIRYLLDFKLRQSGFSVHTATNGKQAYDLAVQLLPDVVIADYQMPGANGLELCKRLKANASTATLPVLMLTARGYKLPPADLLQTNIRELVDKPFSPRRLVALLADLLDNGNQTTEAA